MFRKSGPRHLQLFGVRGVTARGFGGFLLASPLRARQSLLTSSRRGLSNSLDRLEVTLARRPVRLGLRVGVDARNARSGHRHIRQRTTQTGNSAGGEFAHGAASRQTLLYRRLPAGNQRAAASTLSSGRVLKAIAEPGAAL